MWWRNASLRGFEHIIIVTGRGKNAIEDHFDSSPELESFLESKGKSDLAKLVRDIGNMVRFSYTRQKEPLGLGHAVLVAKDLVGNEPFAVLLGDVIIPGPRPATRQLVEVYRPPAKVLSPSKKCRVRGLDFTGIVDVEPANVSRWGERLKKIRDLVEKPSAAEAPFQPGRYRAVRSATGSFRLSGADQTRPGGEIQLTDGLRLLAKETGLYAHVYEGKSYDAGDKLGFLKATVEIGLRTRSSGGFSGSICVRSSCSGGG